MLRASHARKKSEWDARIADVLACPDYAALPRVTGAGRVKDGVQTMHNGVKVVKDCYYRWRGTLMFAATEGVPEPQEERVFTEVLKFVPPGGVMIELGAGKVRFVFVSTHSDELHRRCREQLRKYDFEIIADADLRGSYSVDGVLVGQLRGTKGPGRVQISQRQPPE